ncbi:hypothetical protein C4553_02455 [Candidatus Parcubacteria bacterium]|nr:MAG: hypothetical protein C4553_02455 [Candidatus Parcubacteria bacterium]
MSVHQPGQGPSPEASEEQPETTLEAEFVDLSEEAKTEETEKPDQKPKGSGQIKLAPDFKVTYKEKDKRPEQKEK